MCVLLCRYSLLGDVIQQAGDAQKIQEHVRFEEVSIIRKPNNTGTSNAHSFDSRRFLPPNVLADA